MGAQFSQLSAEPHCQPFQCGSNIEIIKNEHGGWSYILYYMNSLHSSGPTSVNLDNSRTQIKGFLSPGLGNVNQYLKNNSLSRKKGKNSKTLAPWLKG